MIEMKILFRILQRFLMDKQSKIKNSFYMFWPPMAAFMATVLSRLVPRRKPRALPTARREEPFRCEVFKMLKAEGKINDVVIEDMMNWRHSGFNVYCGNAIWPHNESAGGGENLARGTCPP